MKPIVPPRQLFWRRGAPLALALACVLLVSCAAPGVMKFSTFEKLPPFQATVEQIKVSPFSGSYYTSKRAGDTEVDVTIHLRKEDGSALVVRKRTFAMSKGLKLYPPLRKLAVGKKYTFPTDISGPDALE
jgi:hypothetical protein